MTNRIKALCLGLGIFQMSCNDYLKEDSGDLLIPKSVTEYAAVLYSEGYPRTFNSDVNWYKLMTDDVEMGPLEIDPSNAGIVSEDGIDLEVGEGLQAYRWDYNIEDKLVDNNWSARYADILGCNVVIDALPEIVYTQEEIGKYNSLAAQAYALRAYNYFVLVNTYSLPWSEDNLDELGVIIRTTPQIATQPRERSTIREVYNLINRDLDSAQMYAAQAEVSANKHLISPTAIQLLATRVALCLEDWEKVREIGNTFLSEHAFVLDLNTIDESTFGDNGSGNFSIFNLETNNEIVFTFGTDPSAPYTYLSQFALYGLGFRPSYSDEGALLPLYDKENDLRYLAYFMQDVYDEGFPILGIPESWDYKFQYPIKYTDHGGGYQENWRTVEVILNVAEAYTRQSEDVSADAVTLLNQLRRCRIRTSVYTDLTTADFASQDDLLQFVWEERRRELCFEEAMRFWDLRRQGMPQIVHRYYHTRNNVETYVLSEGSPNYVLAIPESETSNNFLITPNSREVIEAQ